MSGGLLEYRVDGECGQVTVQAGHSICYRGMGQIYLTGKDSSGQGVVARVRIPDVADVCRQSAGKGLESARPLPALSRQTSATSGIRTRATTP